MENLLPQQGKAFYNSDFFNSHLANKYFNLLHNEINWQHDEVVLFGKRHITKRMTAWYGSKPYQYTYSNSTKVALPFSKTLLKIAREIASETGVIFNSCLLNLYADGSEGMGWHSDNEKALNPKMPIASISLGTPRKFYFKNRETKERIELLLEQGSLLMMHPPTQEHWLHSLPKTVKIKKPRINLTFRVIQESECESLLLNSAS